MMSTVSSGPARQPHTTQPSSLVSHSVPIWPLRFSHFFIPLTNKYSNQSKLDKHNVWVGSFGRLGSCCPS